MHFSSRQLFRNAPFLLLIVLLVFCSCFCRAQTIKRTFSFQKGDTYQKRTFLNSTFVMQRGTKTLKITSSSSVYKTYKVKDVFIQGYVFDINIPKMNVVINSDDQKLDFDSEKAVDTASKIENALQYMVGKSHNVVIDINGVIVSDNDFSDAQLVNDTLLTFAGIQPESFNKGTQFNITPSFFLRHFMQKGYKWTDTATFNGQTMKTNFWIDRITPTNTIVKFKSAVIGNLVNSNSTGTYIVDNKTGMLVQRLIESISSGYQILNNIVYSTTRRTSLSEDCIKKNEGATANLQSR